MTARSALAAGWAVALAAAVGVRGWNALTGARMWGYDAWGHVAYVLFLDLYRAVPWADQGWSYFHPPLHYVLGWGLAQAGSGELLMRGLALLGSAASVGIAALAARVVRRGFPARPGLALLAFVAVAFLPVHLYTSPMPGNEMTAAFLAVAAVASFVANECRARPTLGGDLATGALVGLGLLTKFSGLVTLVAILAALAARAALERQRPGIAMRRAALLAALPLALAAPYYARNLAEFGTPFELSRSYPIVESVEGGQPPGVRRVTDYLSFPLALFRDPRPRAPHLLHSVWGSVYLNAWADTYRESDVERALEADRDVRRSTQILAALGLAPTALALAGAALLAADAWRGRRRAVALPVLSLGAASLGAFAVFAWQVPLWSSLKASYLLPVSLPYAAGLARAADALSRRGGVARAAVPIAVATCAGAAGVVGLDGAVLPRRADAPATGAVHFYFGEYDAARRVYGRLVAGAGYPVPWLENLAALEIAEGHFDRAVQMYARARDVARSSGRPDAYRDGRVAAATALAGDRKAALSLFGEALARADLPELRANRGAVRAAAGDLAGAEEDLRAALAAEPAMVPAWLALADVLARRGEVEGAARARERAAGEACRGPRRYPYGLGTGEVIEWGIGRRFLLRVEGRSLAPALPDFYRAACARLRAPA